VGGDFPGAPDETTEFPQLLIVDYVRVYGSPVGKTTVPTTPRLKIGQ
jgi:hypothetical protein